MQKYQMIMKEKNFISKSYQKMYEKTPTLHKAIVPKHKKSLKE